jgi:ABC-type phosphate/phosphonate transport system substrate-binding protein
LRRHEPALAAQLRTIATTSMTPIPALVGAPRLPDAYAERLTAALLAVADVDALAPVRATLLLHGFAAVAGQDYATLRDGARASDEAGYSLLA